MTPEQTSAYVPISEEVLDDFRHEYVAREPFWFCAICGNSPEHIFHEAKTDA